MRQKAEMNTKGKRRMAEIVISNGSGMYPSILFPVEIHQHTLFQPEEKPQSIYRQAE